MRDCLHAEEENYLGNVKVRKLRPQDHLVALSRRAILVVYPKPSFTFNRSCRAGLETCRLGGAMLADGQELDLREDDIVSGVPRALESLLHAVAGILFRRAGESLDDRWKTRASEVEDLEQVMFSIHLLVS